MLDQEMASIIAFILSKAGGVAPYYWNVPQHFQTPSAFFPPPEFDTGGETFLTYSVDYAWYIKVFHKTDQDAYAIASTVASAIRGARNLIPLISEDGNVVEGGFVRVNDPKVKLVDNGVAQIAVTWRSRKPYDDTLIASEKANVFHPSIVPKPGKTISDAYAETLERYAVPIITSGDIKA